MFLQIIADVADAAPSFDWKQALDQGLSFSILLGMVCYFIKKDSNSQSQLAEEREHNEEILTKSQESKEQLLKEAIATVNKNSYALESLPSTIKQYIKESLREEIKELKDEITKNK